MSAGLRLLTDLPAYLRRPTAPAAARATLERRLDRREPDFLELLDRTVFQRPASPYRTLLDLAGCEMGDVEQLVKREGLDGALTELARCGVYLSVDEFKGRVPVVRGNTRLTIDPLQLLNPLAATHVRIVTGSSAGPGTLVPVDLAFVRDRAVDTLLNLDARGGLGWRHAHWGVPGGAAIMNILEVSGSGAPPARWFSQVDPTDGGLHPRYRWSGRVLRLGSWLAGIPLPSARHAPLTDPLPVARWMREVRRAGHVPHCTTYVSSAVRLAQATLAAGLDLEGARLTVGGEPCTAARLALIRQAGADPMPRYGATETDVIAYGCQSPDAADDMHLLRDCLAAVQPAGSAAAALHPQTLLFTSLLWTAPFILLNVSLGDRAVLDERRCGCALARLGWTTHLREVRSFEKLTLGGMTFLDSDVLHVLERLLPDRFGGDATDYQLVEQEAGGGDPELRLLVHPRLGPLDPAVVSEAFLTEIEAGSAAARVMGLLWRQAGFPRVERQPPVPTPAGKILHLHRARHAGPA